MLRIIIFLTGICFLSICHGVTPEEWRELSYGEKMEFHGLLLKSLSELDSGTAFDPNLYTLRGGVSRGIASSAKCVYGGWISIMRGGKCRHPAGRNDDYDYCGMSGVNRCNPVIFGESGQNSVPGSRKGRGVCVKARTNSESITWACIKSAYGSDGNIDIEKFRRHLQNLEGNERYLGEYLAMAAEIVENHCNKNSDNFCAKNDSGNSCNQLRMSFFERTGANPALIACKTRSEILLEDIERDISENVSATKEILDIYFPLIEESRVWREIKEEKYVADKFKDEGFWTHRCNPYEILKGHQAEFKRAKGCNRNKTELEEELLGQTPWAAMSLGERADKIYELAKESFEDIKVATVDARGSFVTKLGRISENERNDGNIFHEHISPEIAACFVYHETKNYLHPLKYNFTFCHRRSTSTAYGLGQVTRSTLEDYMNVNKGSNLPMITPEAKKFYWSGHSEEIMSGEDIYRYMALSPKFQMELVLRILNEKAKYIRSRDKDNFVNYLVGRYYGCNDQDSFCRRSKDAYIKNVSNCRRCFEKGYPASDCYD